MSFGHWRLVGVAVVLGLLSGCGDSSGLNRLSGNVTFNKQPIPIGKIYFEPDGSKGNTGAAGFADIKDGKYDTSATGGQGVIGGPSIVRIEGFDGVKLDEERINGMPLFPVYRTTAELPKGSGTMDFDVPADAVKAKR